ncbi:flagellar basal body-associated protein FliL [Paracoccus sp. ME4]|uniref:flagellar basal body-associated FliL family protein n=1 Tax=Paracoccus sp. ME4 TaxID=3138066 RepID=UPI00398ADD29
MEEPTSGCVPEKTNPISDKGDMTDITNDSGTKRPKRRFGFLMLIGTAVVMLGAGGAAQYVTASTGDGPVSGHAEAAAPVRHELEIGRIIVNVRPGANGSKVSHLVIDPVLEYVTHATDGETVDESAIASRKSHFRDAFIDYLANVSEVEVTGSAGMSVVRSELLRRARLVAGNDAPSAVLLQEYILQ